MARLYKGSKLLANITINEGSGIEIPSIENISLNEKGLLSWDALDLSEYEEYNPSVSYQVEVNGTVYTTSNNEININTYLFTGTNNIKIVGKVILETIENMTIDYVKTLSIEVIETTLPENITNSFASTIENNIYIMGGKNEEGTVLDSIYKFNIIDGTVNKLDVVLPTAMSSCSAVAVGTNIYYTCGTDSDGNRSSYIYKFDTTSNTISIVYTGDKRNNSGIALVGTKIYIMGGFVISSVTDKILIFDTETETMKTSTLTLPSATNTEAGVIGTDIYIFGGSDISNPKTRYDFVWKIDTQDTTQSEDGTLTVEQYTLPTPRSDMKIVTIDDVIYLFGGISGTATYTPTYLTEIMSFNPNMNSFETLELTIPNTNNAFCVSKVAESVYLFACENNNEIIKFTA